MDGPDDRGLVFRHATSTRVPRQNAAYHRGLRFKWKHVVRNYIEECSMWAIRFYGARVRLRLLPEEQQDDIM